MVKVYNYIDITKTYYSLDKKKVIIWGKSVSSLHLYVELQSKNTRILGFSDCSVSSSGGTFAGLPIFTYEEIKHMEDIIIYISTDDRKERREILDYLCGLENITILCKGTVYGPWEYDTSKMKEIVHADIEEIQTVYEGLCDKKSRQAFENLLKYRVCNSPALLEEIYEDGHRQYFPENKILTKCRDEIFVDAGGYNGVTSSRFAEWVNNQYKKIYIMEPEITMYHVIEEYVRLMNLHDVELINAGAYSHETKISFFSDVSTGSSRIDENGEAFIQTISIDEMLGGEKATYIKMDIEGAEMAALLGSKETISKYRPKLAISIYHKDDDLWKIPFYIKETYPWYKLYMRHYTPITTETILYASI